MTPRPAMRIEPSDAGRGGSPVEFGRLHGIGLGPGDPDLLTVKAARLLERATVVSYFAKEGRCGVARTIADKWLPKDRQDLPLCYPVTTEIRFDHPDYVDRLGAFYSEAADLLSSHLSAGRDVALLCEGDPLFYGSFMHLYIRLRDRFEVTIVPGVSGMSGCWTAAGAPMTWGDDVLTVLPGTLDLGVLRDRMADTDAVVVMKLGQNLSKVRSALAATGLLERAIYVERGTMADEVVMRLVDKIDDEAPYFAVVLVPGHGRRP